MYKKGKQSYELLLPHEPSLFSSTALIPYIPAFNRPMGVSLKLIYFLMILRAAKAVCS